MSNKLSHQIVRSLLLECLKKSPTGQYKVVAHNVAQLAQAKGFIGSGHNSLAFAEYAALQHVRELLWQFMSQGILAFGMDPTNDSWPFYALTEYGRKVVSEAAPQPYDPDGFLAEFRSKVPTAHATVFEYLAEAVHAFNAGCPAAAAVVLGGASEMAIVELIEATRDVIDDPNKKARFVEATSSRLSITRRYKALKEKIDGMIGAGLLDVDMHDTARSDLDGAFSLIRRLRNDAGHPEMPRDVSLDSVFLTLRLFIEYARMVYVLIGRIRACSATPGVSAS
ncbi:hypothetical protein WMF30_10665 [Sorangium sp. So ce134]